MAGFLEYCTVAASFHYISQGSTRWDICSLKTSCWGSDFVCLRLKLSCSWNYLIGNTFMAVYTGRVLSTQPGTWGSRAFVQLAADPVVYTLNIKLLGISLLLQCGHWKRWAAGERDSILSQMKHAKWQIELPISVQRSICSKCVSCCMEKFLRTWMYVLICEIPGEAEPSGCLLS